MAAILSRRRWVKGTSNFASLIHFQGNPPMTSRFPWKGPVIWKVFSFHSVIIHNCPTYLNNPSSPPVCSPYTGSLFNSFNNVIMGQSVSVGKPHVDNKLSRPTNHWLELLETSWACFNTLRPRQNARHFAIDIFKCILLNENVWILLKISLPFVLKVPINNITVLVQIMAWCWPGDKPLSKLIMVNLLTHICVSTWQVHKNQLFCRTIYHKWWHIHYSYCMITEYFIIQTLWNHIFIFHGTKWSDQITTLHISWQLGWHGHGIR